MGSAAAETYASTAKRLAGRSLLAVGSSLAAGSRLAAAGVWKGVAALTDTGDREPVSCLKFAVLEWSGSQGDGSGGGYCADASSATQRLPVLLVGLSTGFQVWRLDGGNPAELLSRRDGPVTLLEAVPEPTQAAADEEDVLQSDRPLLAVVPAPERPLPPAPNAPYQQQQPQQQQQHVVQLYSLRSQGYVRTLSFSGEVLGVAASSRVLLVALRGQLQAFDAASLRHTFSCLTYTPPVPPLLPAGADSSTRRSTQQQQFVTDGLTASASSAGSDGPQQQPQHQAGAAPPPPSPAAALAPVALGARWLAYAADTPVPAACGQAVAQRVPLARRDSTSSSAYGSPDVDGGVASAAALGTSPGTTSRSGSLKAAAADAALAAAAKGGQQLKAGLAAVGSASFKYLSQQYAVWRQGQQGQLAQRDLDALEADALVAGTVVVRDAASRLVVAHFRAHTSPLAALQFSPGGTLLATASVAGHSVNVFRILPPAPAAAAGAEGGSGGSGGAGQAVWLHRLYRGVTPAAIRAIAFAPDASWVAASSGRGTTHVFHTPGAAPGAAEPGDGSGAAQPPKQAPVGRARKPGLLSSGVAGAATSAARNLYAGHATDAMPVAAAFLSAGPSSPTAAPSPAGSSLYVVTPDGLLTRHLLRPPAPPAAAPGPAASAAPALERQDSLAAAALEEADRWDVGRHASWPEREEALPGPHPSTAPPAEPGAAEQQQLWVAQAESGALAGAATRDAPLPLWRDPQFRFYELQVNALQQQQQRGNDGAHGDSAAGASADALADALQAAALGGGSEASPWLEAVPARAISRQH